MYEDPDTGILYPIYYEADYQGNRMPIYLEGRLRDVDEAGYVTLYEPLKVTPEGPIISSQFTEMSINALYDNNYHMVVDYIAEDHERMEYPVTAYRFYDDLAIIQCNSTAVVMKPMESYYGREYPIAMGNGQFGLINRRGEFVLPVEYDELEYLGEHMYRAVRNGVTETITVMSPEASPPSGWAKDIVAEAIARRIIPARFQNKYQQPVTRAEFCAFVLALYERTVDMPSMKRGTFADTMDVCVQRLSGLGILSGMGGGTFLPDALITREQAAVILANLAQVMEHPLPMAEANFPDAEAIAPWARAQVGQVQNAGLIRHRGDGFFAPQDSLSREECMLIMLNAAKAWAQ